MCNWHSLQLNKAKTRKLKIKSYNFSNKLKLQNTEFVKL